MQTFFILPMIVLYKTLLSFQEEELRKSGEAKYFHLNDDLHVLIEVFAPPAEAYARMGHALEEIKKFLIPVSTCCKLYFAIDCTLKRASTFPGGVS